MDEEVVETKLHKPTLRKWLLIIIVSLLVLVGASSGTWLYLYGDTSPVPKSIRRSVDFPVYYPDPKELPVGYTLNLKSFSSPVKNGVSYSVDYENGKKLIFSAQRKPSDKDIQSFNSNYIPLRIDYQTNSGKAEIGAYNIGKNLHTLVSLPTNGSTWLVITGPNDINQDQLKHVLDAIKIR